MVLAFIYIASYFEVEMCALFSVQVLVGNQLSLVDRG